MSIGKIAKLASTVLGGRGMRSTYRPTVGPFTFNTSTKHGISSVSVGAGPLRFKVWDRKGNTGLSSIDLPGPISYRPPQKTRSERTATPASPFSMNPNVGGRF